MAARFEFDLRFEHAGERVVAAMPRCRWRGAPRQGAAAPFDFPWLQPPGEAATAAGPAPAGEDLQPGGTGRGASAAARAEAAAAADDRRARRARSRHGGAADRRPGAHRGRLAALQAPSSRRSRRAPRPVATSRWRWRAPWCRERSSGSRSPTSRRCCATFWSASRASRAMTARAAASSARSRPADARRDRCPGRLSRAN